MSANPSVYARVFAVGLGSLVAYAVVRIFAPFTGALTWAMFLAFLLHPLNIRLRRKLKGRAWGAGLLTALTPLVILAPVSALSVQFVVQGSSLLAQLQTAAKKFDVHSIQDMGQFPLFARANLWLQSQFSVTADQIQGWVLSGTQELLQKAATLGSSFFLGTVSTLVAFVLMLFLLFFFLRDGDVMFRRARALVPFDESRKELLLTHMAELTRAIVFGTAVTALLQGLMVGIGFAICGLPSPVVFGVLAAFAAMLPVGGTALIWLPGAGWLFFSGHWGYGIFMLIWGVVLSGMDNVLKPLLISGRASISTLAVFLGVLGGISAFGPIGVVAGPVILSLALALLEFIEHENDATRN
jgi:predicted PurR-regulated permease PerM